jgi:hypothetical protein
MYVKRLGMHSFLLVSTLDSLFDGQHARKVGEVVIVLEIGCVVKTKQDTLVLDFLMLYIDINTTL